MHPKQLYIECTLNLIVKIQLSDVEHIEYILYQYYCVMYQTMLYIFALLKL